MLIQYKCCECTPPCRARPPHTSRASLSFRVQGSHQLPAMGGTKLSTGPGPSHTILLHVVSVKSRASKILLAALVAAAVLWHTGQKTASIPESPCVVPNQALRPQSTSHKATAPQETGLLAASHGRSGEAALGCRRPPLLLCPRQLPAVTEQLKLASCWCWRVPLLLPPCPVPAALPP